MDTRQWLFAATLVVSVSGPAIAEPEDSAPTVTSPTKMRMRPSTSRTSESTSGERSRNSKAKTRTDSSTFSVRPRSCRRSVAAGIQCGDRAGKDVKLTAGELVDSMRYTTENAVLLISSGRD